MGEVKQLLNALLWEIYGKQRQVQQWRRYRNDRGRRRQLELNMYECIGAFNSKSEFKDLKRCSVRQLIDICAILKVEIRLMGYILERVLISRDRSRRHQEVLCAFVDGILRVEFYNVHPRMRFSLTPPPSKSASVITSPTNMQARVNNNYSNSSNNNNYYDPRASGGSKSDDDTSVSTVATAAASKDDDDAASDYNQWLHAMKLVARLPGGMPPEFRRKLWLSLADKYLKSKNVDWAKEEEKCFCEKWREDDEELGIQIVKDLHRTGSNLCTGPAGSINQAKLKRILLGYARYNPEVGYCQGFNMLGALILQVMEKEESESMKVMIYLVEGVLPPGYFCGSMGGLQADMALFRELMQTKLPRLAKHLQKLQGPMENAYEPPLTNVFTMQWFLTMFCTCLPMSCVLRVWDLVLIEGSDVLLRTALVLWSLLEERVLNSRTADDFYGKMGSFSSELLNGHLIDSNGLIEKVVQLGPIPDIQKLRDKHLYNITPLRHKQGLQLYFDDEEPGSDEESRLAVATVWGIPWGRRGSQGQTPIKQLPENKDRLALDISLLKKQYDRLRERQKQAHIILTTACSTARQTTSANTTQSLPVNHLLMGRSAILTNKGRRIGPPPGAIPPARKPSLPTVLHTKPPEKQLRRGETLHWRDTDISKRRRDSLTWKEIKADRAALKRENSEVKPKSQKIRSRVGKSDSSSYSDESEDDNNDGSSTDTSLCDDDDPSSAGDKTHSSSLENSPKRKSKSSRKSKDAAKKLETLPEPVHDYEQDNETTRRRPKSWAPSSTEIPFMLMTSDSPMHSGDEQKPQRTQDVEELMKEEEDSATECDRIRYKCADALDWSETNYSSIAGDLATTQLGPLHIQTDVLELPVITSASQLSPMPDITSYLNNSTISPMPTPKPLFLDSTNSLGSGDGDDGRKFAVSDDGVTNQYFERVNSVERPTKLDLFYSLNEEDSIRDAFNVDTESAKDIPEDLRTENTDKVTVISNSESEQTFETMYKAKRDENSLGMDKRSELLLDYSDCSPAKNKGTAKPNLELEQDFANQPRDDNIPGEASEQFEERFHVIKLGTEHESNKAPLKDKKPTAAMIASRKRRDPRRLTLTRSSTIDIEERFQALERRMSEESFKADKSEKIDQAACSDKNESLNETRIPSETELYKTQEKKSMYEKDTNSDHSESKSLIDDSKINSRTLVHKSEHEFDSTRNQKLASLNSFHKVPSISDEVENPSKRANYSISFKEELISSKCLLNDSLEECITKPPRNHIPSFTELEDRFNALERQLSSNNFPSKNPINLSRDDQTDDERNTQTPPNTPTEDRRQKLEKSASKTDIQGADVDKGDVDKAEPDKPHIKKIPSTAELEDRFNALERKMSTQKSSPTKAKKEPPDDEKDTSGSESKRGTKIEEQLDEEPKAAVEKANAKPRRDKERETNEIKEDKSDTLENKARNSETSSELKDEQKSKENQRSKQTEKQSDHCNEEDAQKDLSRNTKKSPPSTEELEKRFNALEKQMSTATLDSTKEKKSETETDELPDKKSESLSGKKMPPKSPSAFEEKCKAINTELSKKKSDQTEKATAKSIKSFEEKCKTVNDQLSKETTNKVENVIDETRSSETKSKSKKEQCSKDKEEEIEESADQVSTSHDTDEALSDRCARDNEEIVNGETQHDVKTKGSAPRKPPKTEESTSSKRRASEPPSTEDLEKRFESLKRRMSTKAVIDKCFTKSAISDKSEHLLEEASEMDEKEKSNNVTKKASKEPPSTEDLESRYEALQRHSSKEAKSMDAPKKTEKKQEQETKEGPTKETPNEKKSESVRKVSTTTEEESNKIQQTKEESTQQQQSSAKETANEKKTDLVRKASPTTKEESNKANTPERPKIPVAPPMPESTEVPIIEAQIPVEQRRALIEEFQSKITVQPNDENIKPSIINPNRKPISIKPRLTPTFDGTSETHANTAFLRSENYEPWHTQPYKMVRRFSDLPSRADLENRLQFLENQLIRKFYKQRCASDSEVASRKHIADMKSKSTDNEMPSTSSKSQRTADELEQRVQALEKQLSENSLKLLEAVRVKAQKELGTTENETPRRLSTETIDATGKELVRYIGELEETSSHKPINISINIKMMLRKDTEGEPKKEPLATAEELQKRLEVLEQQLNISKLRRSSKLGEETKVEQENDTAIGDKKPEETAKNENVDKVQHLEESQTENVRKESLKGEIKNGKADIKDVENESTEPAKIKAESVIEDNAKVELTHDIQQVTHSPSNKEQTTSVKQDIDDKNIVRPKEEKTEKNKVHEKSAGNEQKSQKSTEDKTVEQKASICDKEVTGTSAEKQDEAKKTSRELSEAPIEQPKETITAMASQTAIQVGTGDPNNKTLVLLLDNEPKAVKVRRLTRANTEELENLFQALEKQLSDRNLNKSEDGKLMRADEKKVTEAPKDSEEAKAISQLSKEIKDFTKGNKEEEKEPKRAVDEYDWGPDPVKRHLKRKTVHLPSTKELEARFRSLERQIKLLEDVEKIDVEQRLNEIERKIKLQYSLSHEKDLAKFLELCDGKGLEDLPEAITAARDRYDPEEVRESRTPTPKKSRTPYTSPSRVKEKTPYSSPTHAEEPKSPKRQASPARKKSPARQKYEDDNLPTTEDLEYRYRALDLTRSKSKESLSGKSKKSTEPKKQPIHPLEMLLDPSPDDSDIPTTGELEHRIRVLDEKRKTPSPSRSSRSRSPTIEDIKRQKMFLERDRPKTPIHSLETLVASPTKKQLPTAEELEARMRALEQNHCFDFKTQKTFQEFNQKLKDVVSPSLSFEEFKAAKSREESPRRPDTNRSITPKSALRDTTSTACYDETNYRSTSPKSIRFRDEEEESRHRSRIDIGRDTGRMVGNNIGALQIIEENSKMLQRILKKTLADSSSSIVSAVHAAATAEGLDELGSRLMRETSPLQRTGSHTGVPLRTNDNINERLDSIKNSIKSIDTLCEEKPYRKEKCQRYIDSLFSDSIHFASKKTSLEDLSRAESRIRREYTPSIRISDHSQRPSDYYLGRSMGSADSIRSTSPLRAASPLHHRSNRDLRREISPRRRRDEEREEYESRVRREHMLPNYFYDNHRDLSSGSLIKFYKVDRQLDTYNYEERERSSSRSASRSPLRSPYGSRETMTALMLHDSHTKINNAYTKHDTANNSMVKPHTTTTTSTTLRNNNPTDMDRHMPTYRYTSDLLPGNNAHKGSTNTQPYAPGKLEIRHTTVTSTFYDRLLAEKEIEKKFSRPPSRSPVISPSVTSKSYMDLPNASAATSPKTHYQNLSSPTVAATTTAALTVTTTGADNAISTTNEHMQIMASRSGNTMSGSAYGIVTTYNFPNNTNSYNNSTTTNINNTTIITTNNPITTTNEHHHTANTSAGNSSTFQTALLTRCPVATTDDASNMALRIRSCDNILMQIQSTSTTAAGFRDATTASANSTSATSFSSTLMTTNQQNDTASTTAKLGALTNISLTTNYNSTMTTHSTNSTTPTNITTTATTTTTSNIMHINSFTGFDKFGTTMTTNYNQNYATLANTTDRNTFTSTATATTITSTTATTTDSTILSYNPTTATGLYNPLLPLTLRQPSVTPFSLGLYTSTLNNNNISNNTRNIINTTVETQAKPANATELPNN